VTSEVLAAGHVTVSCIRTAKKKVFSCDLKDARVAVRNSFWQSVPGVWSRKAESTSGEVCTNEGLGQDSCVLVVERRVRTLSRVMMWWLRYVGIEVVRTLNVRTTTLLDRFHLVGPVPPCWTGSQCSWRSNDLALEERSERHCSAHEVSGCCWLEHHGAQRCSSQFLT